jgi:methionine synthase / methylenetetrahydrofolate reductase(NADPH)
MDTYDIVPSALIDLISHRMNRGTDMAGNSIGSPTVYNVGCALNMAADDLDQEIKVLRKKLAAGANFALGQAIYDPARITAFHKRYEELEGHPLELPVLVAVIPLNSLRHAQFMHNEVPGHIIPDAIFKRLEDAGERAPQEGVKIAQEIIAAIRGQVQGAYIIPSSGRYDLAAEVVAATVSAPSQA